MTPPHRPAPALDALCALPLAALRVLAGDEMMLAALPILRERLALTPEKLSLLMLRLLNPDELISKGEESTIRGVHHNTLSGHKDRRELPVLLGGAQPLPWGGDGTMKGDTRG